MEKNLEHIMNLVKTNRRYPDFENILTILNRDKPSRPTCFEFILNNTIYEHVTGRPVPADIEFGFYRNKLVLFQIRPFLESSRARQSLYLNGLDQRLSDKQNVAVDIDQMPAGEIK